MNLTIKNGEITIKGDIELSSPNALLEAKKLSSSEMTETLKALAPIGVAFAAAIASRPKTEEKKNRRPSPQPQARKRGK